VRFVMTWVRSNIKCGTWIALFALVIQFALSFGHFHPIASAGTAAPEVGSALSERSFVSAVSGQVAEITFKRQPASNHDPDEHPGDVCAICAVMAMANAVLFASPPALPLPQATEFSHLASKGESVRVASIRIAFQPRAPPIS
jgi:Protein of unknown function (DUF2946)